jgi:hypothetical protein
MFARLGVNGTDDTSYDALIVQKVLTKTLARLVSNGFFTH